jgi:hypothetical protein
MRVEFCGLIFETPGVTFYLWSPWRAAALEHRLFEQVRGIPRTEYEESRDELRVHVRDPRAWQAALKALFRVLKGWQEEGDPATERRVWRWLVEADSDADGYDHMGEPTSLWAFLRLSLERGGPGEGDKGEDVDLEGFGLQIWGESSGGPSSPRP